MYDPDDIHDEEYTVGYGKPPRHAQFKKGQSGNARGRPPKSLNLTTLVQRELSQTVVVNQNGRRKTITKAEAMITQQVNKAAGGDLRAFTALLPLFPQATTESESNGFDSIVDQQVAADFMKRLRNSDMSKAIATKQTEMKKQTKSAANNSHKKEKKSPQKNETIG